MIRTFAKLNKHRQLKKLDKLRMQLLLRKTRVRNIYYMRIVLNAFRISKEKEKYT